LTDEEEPMADGPLTQSQKNRALALLASIQFLIILDASIMNVAIPSIGADLRIASDSLAWVVGAYTLVFGGLLLLGGRLADVLGRRRVFVAGLVVFGVASLAGGLAGSPAFLVGARAVQGLGAALVAPAALSMVTTTFAEGTERNRALTVWGAVSGIGGAAGVLLGGALTELSWRWVLLVNVPVCVAAVALAPRLLRESVDARAGRAFDVAGAVLATAGLGALVFAFIEAEQVGWGSAQTVLTIGAALLALAAFAALETRVAVPLLPLGIFRLRTLSGANVATLLISAGLFGMFFLVSLYLQTVLGYSALEAGLAYLPLALTALVVAGAANPVVDRVGFKPVATAGLVLLTLAYLGFSGVSPGGSYLADVLPPALLAGAGIGLTYVALAIGAVAGTRPDQAGIASGLYNTSQQVGGALGVALMSTLAFASFDGARPDPAALTGGMRDAFLVAAALGVVAVLVALVTVRRRDVVVDAEGRPLAAAA
jgi:EmrB/QacA subfamily drug resistance transporter